MARSILFFVPAEGRRMGEPNAALNVYMSKKERIRDVCEFYMGEKLSTELEIVVEDGFYSLRGSEKLTFRERDVLKKVRRADGKKFLLGIENQMTNNLTFPQRILEMDSLEYKRQAEKIREKNKRDGVKYEKKDDFKYGFREEDRMNPVCNLMLYWGKDKSGTPASLKDMVDMEALPEPMKGLFNDYRVHTVSMLEIPDEDLEKMESDIKYVVGMLKRTGRGKEYQQFILEHQEYFRRIPSDACEVIRVCAGIKDLEKYLEMSKENGEETVDMCRAIYEIKRDARREGKREGKHEAIFELLEDYGELPEETKKRIEKEKNMEKLKVWHKLAAKAESIEEFCAAL